ncbi:MAG: ACP S-malonyltransferase [Chlamydiia bacterium]
MKVVLLTPGQGAQSVLMGQDFYENFTIFRQTFEEAEDYTRLSIRKWIYEGSSEELSQTDRSQLAIYVTTMGISRVLEEICPEVEIGAAIGLSLGEYSVLTIAGALNFKDGVELVRKRGELMQEASIRNPGKMAAVLGLTQEQIEPHLVGSAVLANLNTPLQSVISGKSEDIEVTSENLKKNGAKRVIPLDVRGAFHSSLMESAYLEFKSIVDATPFQIPRFPIVMNATATFESNPEKIRVLLSKQLVSSVKFRQSAELVGKDLPFLELGPGTIVKGLIQKNIDATVLSINTLKDLKEFKVCACL